MQEYLAEVSQIKNLTVDVIEFSVRIIAPDSLQYKAGQSMRIKVDGSFIEVPIAAPPLDSNSELTFCVQPSGSFHQFVRNLATGSQIKMEGPTGEFGVDVTDQNILCIASGSGIAVFASIIPNLLLGGFVHKVKLLFEVPAEDEMFYFSHFSGLAVKHPNFTFTPIVVSPRAHWPGEVGTATTFVKVSGASFADHGVYIAGHKNFVDPLIAAWRDTSLEKQDVYTYVMPDAV